LEEKNLGKMPRGTKVPDADKIAQLLKEIGFSPEDPHSASELLNRVGIDSTRVGDKEEVISLINQFTAGLDPETKEEISRVIEQTAQYFGCGPMPDDVRDFLEKWKKS